MLGEKLQKVPKISFIFQFLNKIFVRIGKDLVLHKNGKHFTTYKTKGSQSFAILTQNFIVLDIFVVVIVHVINDFL